MVVMSYMYQGQSSDLITFNAKERLGVEYVAPLQTLITTMQQSRGLYHIYSSNNDAAVKEQIDINNTEIEQAFQETFAVDDKLANELKIEGKIHEIYDDWKKMGETDSFASHTDLIDRSNKLIAIVGDSSNLILDPDLDSYYLMDGVVNKIPFANEKLAQIRDLGSEYLQAKSMTDGQRDQLLALISLLNYSTNDISNGINLVIEQNPSLKPELEASRIQLEEERNKFTELVNKELLSSSTLGLPGSEYFEISSAFIQNNSELYHLELKLLDKLIQNRVDAYEYQALIFNIAVIIGFIILLYIFIGFYISVKKSITYINTSLIQVSQGDLANRPVAYSKDEIGDIVQPINTVISEFRNMISASITTSSKVSLSSSDLSKAITHS